MHDSSSSDGSEQAERIKNVRSLLVKSKESQRDVDENYAYKQKLGDLKFNADFEGGNLGGVTQVGRYEYDLMIRPDVSNPRYSIWFNFTVSNQRPNQCIILNFTNISGKFALFNEVGLTPVARSRSEPNWVRLRKNQVFYYQARGSENKHYLSIAFRFTFHDDEHQFALFYPYTLSTLTNFITRWTVHLRRREVALGAVGRDCNSSTASRRTSRSGTPARLGKNIPRRRGLERLNTSILVSDADAALPIFEVDVLTESILSKPIYELTISSRCFGSRKSNVIIIGRPAGNVESVSSLVCQGLLDFTLSDDAVAGFARSHFNFTVFPMLDPDSIWVGNSKTDLFGQRTIDASIVSANPSIYQNYRLASRRIEHICAASQEQTFIIELRANPDLVGSRAIGTLYADSMRMEKHLQLPRLLSRFSDGFYLEKCKFFDAKVGRMDGLFRDLGRSTHVESYQLEVSTFGYYKRSLVEELYEEYDQIKYLLLGKAMVYSLVSLRQNDKQLPSHIREHLRMFQQTPQDIDDLMLY